MLSPQLNTLSVMIFVSAFIITLILIPLVKRLSSSMGAMGYDVHKPDKPLIPKLGGLAIFLGTLTPLAAVAFIFNIYTTVFLAYLLSAIIASSIGLVEDLRELNPILKPLLISLAGLPIILFGVYSPTPELPFIGQTRMFLVYPLLIIAGYAVLSNAINSTDVLNGSMALMSIIALIPLIVISYVRGEYEAFIISLTLLGSLIAFLTQNKYPSKIFAGNVGSLFVGATIATIAIVGKIEVAAIIALMPQIMNEFHIIFSIGGLKSARYLAKRPVEVRNGMLYASRDRDSPVTLVRLITAIQPMTEPMVVRYMAMLSAYAAILALITQFLLIG